MERLKTSNVSISNCKIKYPIGKALFAVNLSLEVFSSTEANTDIGSVKSLHTFHETCLYHMLVQFELNRVVQTTQSFELFDKNRVFLTIFDKALTPFSKTFL